MRLLIILSILGLCGQAYGQFRAGYQGEEPPSVAELLLPGGTHFHEGNIGKGLFFATAETGLFASAIIFDEALKAENNSEYYNYPFIFGQQLYAIDKGDYYLRDLNHILGFKEDFRYEAPSFRQMLTAPLRPKVLKKPLVWGITGFAVLENVLFYALSNNSRPLQNVKQVSGYGNTFSPGWGSAVYGGTGGLISWGAGVSEEMIFRGYLQPALHYTFGPKVGLWGSTLLFSAAHLPSYLQIKDPLMLAWSVSQITGIAYLFGLNAQNNHYDIQTVIAAHAWYDIAIMATSWLMDPQNNPLGFRVAFSLD